MSSDEQSLSKEPSPDRAEYEAYFPSPYSLSQYVPPKSDFTGADYPDAYTGGRWKVLVVCTDERYVPLKNDTLFSSGNHPVETLIPVMHLAAAGFGIDIATVSGNPAKMEMWAMPADDQQIWAGFHMFLPQMRKPKALDDVLANDLGADSDYAAVLIPGGHGALVGGIPDSQQMHDLLKWTLDNDKFIITLCHGPACLLSGGVGDDQKSPLFSGYASCVFPNSIDAGANVDIGYVPGHLTWMLGEALTKQGITVVNKDMTGQCHRDRKLLSGDSPLAGNKLGQLAARAMLDELT